MKTVKKFAPYIAQQMIYIENYFSDMAKSGLFLKKWSGFFAEFEVNEPKGTRYRIVPKSVEKEEIEIFNGSGWDYVCSKGVSGELSVFCTDDETAPELFTDMGSYKIYMKKFARSCFLNILLIPLMLLCYCISLDIPRNSYEGPLHILEDPVLCMLYVPIIFVFVYWLLHFILNIRICIQIKKGIEAKRDKSYKKILGIWKTVLIIWILSLIIAIIGVFGTYAADDSNVQFDKPVSLKELDDDTWNSIQHVLNNDDWSDDHKVFHEIDERREMWMDAIDVYSDYESSTIYRAHYYEFKSEKLAELYLNEEIAYSIKQDLMCYAELVPDIKIDDSVKKIWKLGIEDVIKIPSDEVDYVGYYETADGQNMFIRDGKSVEMIHYVGHKELLNNIDLFIENIKE